MALINAARLDWRQLNSLVDGCGADTIVLTGRRDSVLSLPVLPHVAYFDGLQVMSLIGFAGILELFGGALPLIGLFTRPVAFVLSGSPGICFFHRPRVQRLCGVAHAERRRVGCVVLLVFLFFAAAGGGAWSVDALRSRK